MAETEHAVERAEDGVDGDLPAWVPGAFDLAGELAANPRLRQEDLDELATWARKQHALPAMQEGDFVKFLHSCEYDVLAAQQCINYYYRTRSTTPSVFCDRDVRLPSVRAQLNVLDFVVVPRLAPDGCRIIINGLTDPDPRNYVFEDHQKLLLMMMDAMVAAEPTLPGVYIIYDLDMGLISHFWKFGFWLQRKLFAYFQGGLPLLLKSCILLHTPSYINTVMKVLRNFTDRKRLDETKMFEGDDFAELHKLLPRECLPSDYGGTLPSRKELHEMTWRRLDSLRDSFAEEEEALKKK
ncbi:alpha-tocopherol transfer protein-like [Thrips palmi]|uniref:Alpha-tocopherol transfer protein-like n=1 Tax=Thrips palmi TaxID=161013 RepID=A0A6P8Y3U5_THRPL|nr:alpha-tocopherol transfer protein-like [Thrips palmi]